MNLQLDLTLAKVVQTQFDDYLQSEVLFWPVGVVDKLQLPQLTIGTWLASEWRLALLAPAAPELAEARATVRKVRSRASEPYLVKARREFKSRVDTWTMFLDEALEKAASRNGGNASSPSIYSSAVQNRFKLELLKNDAAQLQDQLQRLTTLDMRLKARFKTGDFVWEPELQPAASKETYWWLWGKL